MNTATSIASRSKLPLVAVGVFALLGTGGWAWRRQSQPPLDLLARAYTSRRLLEYRIPGARYAPMSTQRGDRRPDSAPELLQSQLRIIPALFKAGNQGGWFHAKGRAELIELKFDEAIRSLQTANDLGEDSANFWTDFGSAYAGRAALPNAAIDYTKAIELFSEALKREPKNAAALYNRGLSESKLWLLDGAIRDFEASLKVDLDQAWKKQSVESLTHLHRDKALLFGPVQESPELTDELEFELRLRDWGSAAELRSLSSRLETVHGDRWLKDVMDLDPSRYLRAIKMLARLAGGRVRYEVEMDKTPDGIWISSISLPPPLAAWRDYELLFRGANALDPTSCNHWSLAERSASELGYAWFAVQDALQLSACAAGLGALEQAHRLTQLAIDRATEAHYKSALIRARGFAFSRFSDQGRFRESAEAIRQTLGEVMRGAYPLVRSHQAYAVLAEVARKMRRWNVARDAMAMASAVAGRVDLKRIEMFNRNYLAEYQLRTGDSVAAHDTIVLADQLASRLQPDPAITAYLAYNRARLAAVEGNTSDLAVAESVVSAVHNLFLDAPFYTLRAEAELQRGNPVQAGEFARIAIERISSQPAEIRKFRPDDHDASAVLIRALIDLHQYPSALSAWRAARRRSLELPDDSPAVPTFSRRLAIVPTGDLIGLFDDNAGKITFRWAGLSASRGLAKVRKLRALCADPNSSVLEIEATSRDLWNSLAGPAVAASETPFGIEAEGEWAAIPLLLVIPESEKAEYLAPGGPSGGTCKPFTKLMAIVQADKVSPDLAGTLPPLPFLPDEQSRIGAFVPGLEMIDGEHASSGAMDHAVNLYRWLHFSGHALRWRETAALAVAPDLRSGIEGRRLGLWTLDDKHICSELIFFAACSTASFHETESVGTGQLASTAIRAGSRFVVATLWDVDSAATTEFTVAFYRRLTEGHRPAVALREAASALRLDQRYRHPYYWAPFVIFEKFGS